MRPYYKYIKAAFGNVFFLFIVVNCHAQSICSKLNDLKQKYYGFSPTDLTTKQINAKSADLDKFWELAKTDTTTAAACLNDMILAESKDTYFCFDAASLLLSIDHKNKYLGTVAEGLKKCNLKELQLETYLRITYFLGRKGINISELAEKLISEPNATVFLTNHVITLSATDASLFLYNVMGTNAAEQSLINTIKNGNTTGRNNAAIVLNMLSTSKGDSVVNGSIVNKLLQDSTIKYFEQSKKENNKPVDCKITMTRDEVLGQLKAFPEGPGSSDSEIAGHTELICAAIKLLTAADIDVVRAARDRSTPGLSDEALYDYVTLTDILIYLRNK